MLIREAQFLEILEITCSQDFIVFGYDQKLLWFFFGIFRPWLGYARGPRKSAILDQKWKIIRLGFQWYHTLSLRNKDTITTMYSDLFYDKYFRSYHPKSSVFREFWQTYQKNTLFFAFSRKVLVVEQNQIHGCYRIFIPERKSMISLKSEPILFSLLVQNRQFSRAPCIP